MRRKHRDLLAWQHAIELVKVVYRLTALFPDSERYGLTAQMRRAAVSVPSNIAEAEQRISDTFGLLNGLINSLKRMENP